MALTLAERSRRIAPSATIAMAGEAKRLKVRLDARTAPGRVGTVLRQRPEPGVAVAPGLRVKLVVGDGSRT